MKQIVAWFADNHVAANLLMLFLLVGGAVTAVSTKVEVFPETDLDIINISTSYPGASPAEVEEGIIRQIEEKIAGLAGIERIDSVAREGFGSITIEVVKDWDLKKLLEEVKAEIDRITTLPEESEKPTVSEVTRRSLVINVAIYGDVPEATLKNLGEKIKDDITNLPDISLADIRGMRSPEIQIEISETTLRRYGLTLDQVADAVRRASLDLPAGRIKTSGGEILIRTKGRRYFADEYRDVAIITRTDGSKVTLGQIAELRDGFEDVDVSGRFMSQPAAMIHIYRVADQNALQVAETVKRYVDEIRGSMPAGVKIDYYRDRSDILKSRLNLLLRNLGIGLVLVSFLLWLFMDIRLAFWVTLGIPISFAAGLMVLPQFGVSINMISLFAFIMVLGIVVDDAIIVGENIYRKQEEGLPPLASAVEGAVEVGRPVVFAVLTTVVAFWPLMMASGTTGKIMRNIPIVVILVLLASLVESLLILPAHLNRSAQKRRRAINGSEKRKITVRWLKWVIAHPYNKMVHFCVRWRYATVAGGIALLVISFGLWKAGWVQFTFFPRVEGNTMRAYITMPTGTPVERTREVINHVEQAARQVLEEAGNDRSDGEPSLMKYSLSLIGRHSGRGGTIGTGGHLGQVWINLLESEKRKISTRKLAGQWRKQIGTVPDAESISFRSEIHSAGNPIEVHLSSDDPQLLLTAADTLKAELQRYPGVYDIGDSYLPGKKELQLRLKPAARSLGLTLTDLARQVRNAFYGAEALRLQRDQDEVKVMVRYPEAERRSLGYVEEMRIRTPDGNVVPFNQVAEVNMEQGYTTIERAQRRRVIKVTADVDENVTNANQVRTTLAEDYLPTLKTEFYGLRYTIEGVGKQQKEAFSDVFKGFALALFGIYALLAIPFRSFTQPLIVMAAIPFGFVGAMAGHLLMGFNLSILSVFGMVGLAGVVVNDSLVLVYAANRLAAAGQSAISAVTQAGGLRFRAIILTSLTTFVGLTPMLLEKSVQARFLIPMAVSLSFGVLFSTVITLILIPCGYVIHRDIANLLNTAKTRWLGIGTDDKPGATPTSESAS